MNAFRKIRISSLQFFCCIITGISMIFSMAAFAVEPQPGQVYSGGTEISVASLGIMFVIPENWKGALSPEGESFLMEPPNATATMFAIADTMSRDEAFSTMQGPIPLTDTVQLVLKGQVNRGSDDMSAKYSVSNNPQLTALAKARAGKNGTSIAFFLVSSVADMKTQSLNLEKVFGSLVMENVKPMTPAASTAATGSSSTDKSWQTYLKGKHIVRFFTGSGYSEEQQIWLCSNGQYVRRFDSGGFGGGASGAFQGNYDGSWHATGEGGHGQLILQAQGNQVSTYDLRWDYQKNQLFVDGKRWLHDKNNVCN